MPRPSGKRSIAENKAILAEYCSLPRTLREMMEHIGLEDPRYFRANYIVPMQKEGLIRKTNLDKPTSRYQQYISTNLFQGGTSKNNMVNHTSDEAQYQHPQIDVNE